MFQACFANEIMFRAIFLYITQYTQFLLERNSHFQWLIYFKSHFQDRLQGILNYRKPCVNPIRDDVRFSRFFKTCKGFNGLEIKLYS